MKAVSFFFFCFLFLISFVFLFKCLIFFSGALKETFLAYISEPLKNLPQIELKKEEVFPPEINAKSAISIQIFPNGKERVLFQKNPEDPLPIASLTKLMTALVVLENPQIYDLKNTKIQISERAANQKNSPYCGNLDSMVGEKFDVKTLLDLSLICSSNDAAFALSELIGTERFVEKMNQEAQKIGLKNTYFFNPHGLDPPNNKNVNYSTVKDLAKLSQYILQNYPLIFEITTEKNFFPVRNGIFNLKVKENQKILGGKTGYTKVAGGSLIFIFQNEKKSTFLNIILGTENEESRIKEMQKIIDWINYYYD